MDIKRKCGIAGSSGMVGGSIQRYFEKKDNYQLFLYDKGKGVGSPFVLNEADFIYVCVPTPFEDGKCDTSIVEEVIGGLKGEKVVIIKSTIIPGTTERLQKKYPQHKILFSPEFLTEETADQDMEYPDRQIIGYTDKSFDVSGEIKLQLPLAPFVRIMPATEAEMVKYAGNCWFGTKVAFANQIYDLCKKISIDYKMVLEGMAADKRIGRTHLKIMHKGFRGFGGKCLPKDLKALISFAKTNNVFVSILKSVDAYNDVLIEKQGLDPLDTGSRLEFLQDKEERYTSSKEVKHKKK